MIDENRTEYGMLMAIAVLSLVPSLIFFGWRATSRDGR
jgi:ABC-type glycerol-3-phosphate transport system permease component